MGDKPIKTVPSPLYENPLGVLKQNQFINFANWFTFSANWFIIFANWVIRFASQFCFFASKGI